MSRVLRSKPVLLVIILILAACTSATPTEEAPPAETPLEILQESADNIRGSETFRMIVEQSGDSYKFPIIIDEAGTSTYGALRRALAQWVAPDGLQATASVRVGAIPLSVDILARGANQWLRFVGTSWISAPFAPKFNPVALIAEESGFNKAMTELAVLENMGDTTLEDGTPVHHLRGIATGPSVAELLIGLIEDSGDVQVDVFIDRVTRFPVLIIVTDILEEGSELEPTFWRIEIFDVNAESEIDNPES
jgi:hypothetical protein